MKRDLRVLLIEDSAADAELIIHKLYETDCHLEYELVDTSRDTRRALGEKRWDVILCDYSMPNFDPYIVLDILRETELDIPLIVISGKIGEDNAVKLLKAGCHDCIMKSDLSRLSDVINRETKEAIVREENRILNKKLQKYQILCDAANDVMLFLDIAGNIQDVNSAAIKCYGYNFEELITMSILDLGHVSNKELVKQQMETATAGNSVYEVIHYRKDNTPFFAEVSSQGILLNGQKVLFSIVRDITEQRKAVMALKESEERFQLLFESAPLGYQSLDFEGRFLNVNQKWIETLGYSKDEVIGKWFGDFLCPEYVDGFRQRFLKFKTQGHVHSEFNMPTKDGQRLVIAFEGTIGTNAEGEFKQTHCMLQDITEQRKAEKALLESEAKYRTIIETTQDGFFVVDAKGRIIDANETYCRMTGYTKTELLEMNIREVDALETAQDTAEHIEKIVKNGSDIFETRHKKKDGSLLDVEVSTTFVDRDAIIFAFCRNITERKMIEVQLQQNMNDLLESQRIAHVGTWRLDLVTNKVVWSEELYKMYGFDPTIPPPPYTEHMKLFTPESWNRLSTSLERTSTLGIPYELELETVTKEGMNSWMWVRGEAEKNSQGNIITLRGAAQDITIRKNAENKLKRSEEKFQLLFNQAPLAYLALDSNACFIEVNQKWLDTFGYGKEEVIGQWLGAFLCPEYVEAFCKRFELFKARGFVQSEVELFCKDGRRLLIAFEGRIAYDVEGKFKQTHGIMQDITEQRRTEKALVESESRYRQLSEQSRTFTWETDSQGLYTFVDQVSEKVLGYRPEELIRKKHFYDLCPDDERETLKQAAFETFRQKGLFNNLENKALTKTGTLIALSTNGFPILKENGSLLGYRGSDTDITTRKQIENERRKFFLIIESSSEFIGMCDFDMNPIYVNPAGQRMVGLPDTATACQVKVQDYFFPEDQQFIAEEFFPRVLKEGHGDVEIRLRHFQTGEPIWMFYYLFSVLDDKGTPVGWATVSRDITERKMAENELIYISNHDHLTGLYNRRYFEDQAHRIDVKENLPLSIIMADTNGLKMINDSFGHDMGDELLKKAANVIKQACRTEDIIVRYGGDEFIVVMTNTNSDEVGKIARAITDLVLNVKVANIDLSISCGYATKYSVNEPFIEILSNAENHMYRQKLSERSSMRSKTIEIIMNTLFEKSHRESQHSVRVSKLCQAITREMNNVNQDVNKMRIAGLVHDIGKIGIDEKILNKEGKLDNDEWMEMKKHPEAGWRILSSSKEFEEIAQYILHHHERWDGNGYPNKLAGEQIPLESRIITVADAYDAMTSQRSYKSAMSHEEAVKEIMRCSGTQFDPTIVEILINMTKMKDIILKVDGVEP